MGGWIQKRVDGTRVAMASLRGTPMPEILHAIFGHLEDDARSLWNCALTCRYWLPVSRDHLFQTIDLSSRRTARFAALLQRSPHLGQHVKRFSVVILSETDARYVSLIAPSLGSVSRLCLHYQAHSLFDKGPDVSSEDGVPLPAPCNLAAIGPVQELQISGNGHYNTMMVATVLDNFPHVQKFAWSRDASASLADAQPLAEILTHIPLKYLQASGLGACETLAYCFCLAAPAELEHLEFSYTLVRDVEHRALAAILLVVGSSLKTLAIGFNGVPSNAPAALEWDQYLDSCPRLEYLQFTLSRSLHLVAIAGLLSRLFSPCLQQIDLNMSGYNASDEGYLQSIVELLEDLRRFPALETVVVKTRGSVSSQTDPVWDEISRILAPLRAMGIMILNNS
ncbi:hypothetical protein OBBRIDRAFT_797191 [Obba rivulosa]|uniref:F-box domain-containing protein n=1 Tax=Obba rivulosa TaxID=1052685 RepID=A0A8E2ANB9_9APHY|nr:hypothetical protein OBBRIDRAFT_797191 [Obba rivulosa]